MTRTAASAPTPLQTYWPPQVKKTLFILLICIAVYFALLRLMFADADGLFVEGDIFGGDFVNFWSAAKLALDGKIMTLFDLGAFAKYQQQLLGHELVYHNWSYPLHILPWILGLGLLSYPVALFVWLGITFALYAFSVAYKQPNSWLIAGALLLAPSSYENIIDGQNGFLSAACMVAGLRLLEKKPRLSGIAFGFLTFKPQLGLLAPILLLAGRYWKTVAATLTTVAALAGLSILLFGIEPWLAYFHVVMPFQTRILELPPIHPFEAMLPTPFMAMRHLGASLQTAYAVAAMFSVAMAASVAYVFSRPLPISRRAAIVLSAMLLATPYGANYDMPSVSAAVILALIAQQGRSLSAYATCLFVAVWFLPICLFMLNAHGFPIGPVVLSAFLVWQLRQTREILSADHPVSFKHA